MMALYPPNCPICRRPMIFARPSLKRRQDWQCVIVHQPGERASIYVDDELPAEERAA